MRYNIELSKLLSDNPYFKADYDVFVNQEPPPIVSKYLRQRLGIGYKRSQKKHKNIITMLSFTF